jgi:hypothetical protein
VLPGCNTAPQRRDAMSMIENPVIPVAMRPIGKP